MFSISEWNLDWLGFWSILSHPKLKVWVTENDQQTQLLHKNWHLSTHEKVFTVVYCELSRGLADILTHTIHGTGIFPYISLISMANGRQIYQSHGSYAQANPNPKKRWVQSGGQELLSRHWAALAPQLGFGPKDLRVTCPVKAGGSRGEVVKSLNMDMKFMGALWFI